MCDVLFFIWQYTSDDGLCTNAHVKQYLIFEIFKKVAKIIKPFHSCSLQKHYVILFLTSQIQNLFIINKEDISLKVNCFH